VRAKDVALAARRESGGPEAFTFALHVPAYISGGSDPWSEVKKYYHYLRWKYSDMGAARASANAGSPLTPETEQQLRSTIMCGSADEVAGEVRRFADALGDDIHFIFRSDFPGMPQDQQLRLIDTLGTQVLPQLRA
jgi:alkanesulfonate monooxygenase SsuD/methylene tetrahydromethanopterin reductase-like flavin-dependent oxidoreductase (luciferase family)